MDSTMRFSRELTHTLIRKVREMNTARELLIMVLRCDREVRIQKRVEKRVRENLCLGENDDGTHCCGTPVSLGLCKRCHNRFTYQLSKKPRKERAEYKQRLISIGSLLAEGEVCDLKNTSVWKRHA